MAAPLPIKALAICGVALMVVKGKAGGNPRPPLPIGGQAARRAGTDAGAAEAEGEYRFGRPAVKIVLVVVLVLDLAGFDYDYENDDEDDALRVCRRFTKEIPPA